MYRDRNNIYGNKLHPFGHVPPTMPKRIHCTHVLRIFITVAAKKPEQMATKYTCGTPEQRSRSMNGHKGEKRMERMRGIEPPYAAWEAAVLPLNYIRIARGRLIACPRPTCNALPAGLAIIPPPHPGQPDRKYGQAPAGSCPRGGVSARCHVLCGAAERPA